MQGCTCWWSHARVAMEAFCKHSRHRSVGTKVSTRTLRSTAGSIVNCHSWFAWSWCNCPWRSSMIGCRLAIKQQPAQVISSKLVTKTLAHLHDNFLETSMKKGDAKNDKVFVLFLLSSMELMADHESFIKSVRAGGLFVVECLILSWLPIWQAAGKHIYVCLSLDTWLISAMRLNKVLSWRRSG
jgi:hypothetical protein